MGLFKKIFSIGRKSKKQRANLVTSDSLPAVHEHLKPCQDDDAEAAVSRLLRSSSGRCAPEVPMDLASLPLPHPINSVIPHPGASSTTLASVSRRSTFSVTVHGRTVHSRTEFPNAYPPMDKIFTPKRSLTDSARRRSKSVPITPRDKSRLLALRQDPSVASLLDHYDAEGRLDSAIFSNTPSPRKDGRIQRRRTGSTLRQLLGHPSSPELRNTSTEGDISWAEKVLGETDSASSISSAGPLTPADPHFNHAHLTDDNRTLSVECDTSAPYQRTFSSLEVELSVSTDHAHYQALNSPYKNHMTSQRASQIFGFLGDKKRAQDGSVSRLPQLKTSTTPRRFSADSSSSDTKPSGIPLPRRSCTHIPLPTSPASHRRFSSSSDFSKSAMATTLLQPQLEQEETSPSQAIISQHTGQSTRGPRGPRPPSRIPSRLSSGPLPVPCDVSTMEQPRSTQLILGERANVDDKYIGVTATRAHGTPSQIPKLRSASGSSSRSAESRKDVDMRLTRRDPIASPLVVMSKGNSAVPCSPVAVSPHDKENDALSRLPQPVTPIRPFSLHAAHLQEPPSPASSSELSPVAKQMMANLRQQRMQARLRDRQAGRLGSSQSRIRY